MEIYVDTANEREVDYISKCGFVDGITTNPSIIAKESLPFEKVMRRINSQIDGKIWMQVTEKSAENMYQQGLAMNKWVEQAVIKLPMTDSGLEAAYQLTKENIIVNMTLIYTLEQVMLAAKANVDYISPYIGRMEDNSLDSQSYLQSAKDIITSFGAKTKIIGASIRSTETVVDLSMKNLDAVTMPFPIYQKLFESSLTKEGLEKFDNDWEQYLEKIKTSNFN